MDAELIDIRKTFDDGNVVAVDNINLHIEEGELIVLVGPSGCGKSTTLRCIAGLEELDSGTIKFGDHDVTNLPPKDRHISMVFQNYALYPSMTVFENMAFGLRMRNEDREMIEEQVRWAAEIMEIPELLDRRPKQLSGGQQQRVALGRAIVREPALFLLDEPLSNLDAKLRSIMRTEIQELQRRLNVSTVFVTHDQEEAMSLGDRIVVMNNGNIAQIGTPEEIYHNPHNLFVASFIGSPEMNLLQAEYSDNTVSTEHIRLELPDPLASHLSSNLVDNNVVIGIRPEGVNVTDPGDGLIDAEINVRELIGDTQVLYFDIGGARIRSVESATLSVEEGERVGLDFNRPSIMFFQPEGEKIFKWGEEQTDETATSTQHGDEISTN